MIENAKWLNASEMRNKTVDRVGRGLIAQNFNLD